MTPASTPSTAPRTGLWLLFRKTVVFSVILLSLLYAMVIFRREWGTASKEQLFMNRTPILRALLLRQGAQWDVFDFTLPKYQVRSVREPEPQNVLPTAPHLLSSRAILVATETGAYVRDMGSSYTYNPLAADQGSAFLSLSRNTNFIYYIPNGPDHTHLHIDFAQCGKIADIPLPKEELWYDASKLFHTLALPTQQKMVLSPAETSLALVHHQAFPRITIVHLIERQAIALSVPSFNPEQLHFSPFFIDDQTLLFSVLDRNHWGTVQYHVPTGTYEILSENFTDHAYHALSGDVILQQSFFDGTINIPFGSVALLEQKRGVAVQQIELLIGSKQSRDSALFSLLFQNPDEPLLHFKADLTTQSFNVIAESETRESLRTFWRDYQLKLSHSAGVFRLFTLHPDDSFTTIETIPFEIRPPATSAPYGENVEPLLRALALPPSLIEEYRKRSTDATSGGDFYTLIDDLSY